METALAELTAVAAAPDTAALLAAARSGAMPLPEVMERAQALHNAGHTQSAVLLYETWLAHTESPLRHVACFN